MEWTTQRGFSSGAPTVTPAELKSARHALGLSAEGLARVVGVESGRTVRRWEAGERDIPGPVIVVMRLLEQSADVRRRLLTTR